MGRLIPSSIASAIHIETRSESSRCLSCPSLDVVDLKARVVTFSLGIVVGVIATVLFAPKRNTNAFLQPDATRECVHAFYNVSENSAPPHPVSSAPVSPQSAAPAPSSSPCFSEANTLPFWVTAKYAQAFSGFPSTALVARTYKGAIGNLNDKLFPSVLSLWPWEFWPVVFVFDRESSGDEDMAWSLIKRYPFVNVSYQSLPEDSDALFPGKFQGSKGYDRQQYDTFFLDLHTSADAIAIMDTDVTLSGFVMPEGIFAPGGRKEDGGHRIRIKGTQYYEWHQQSTAEMIGKYSIGDFMCHFPIVFWRSTLANLRRHLARQSTNGSAEGTLDDVWRRLARDHDGIYSQFTVIGSYAWHYERDRYDWHIEGYTPSRRDASDPPEPASPEQPLLELGNHWGDQHVNDAKDAVEQSICHASNYSGMNCARFKDTVNPYLFSESVVLKQSYPSRITPCEPQSTHLDSGSIHTSLLTR